MKAKMMNLKKQLPTDVIKSAYYSAQNRNDSGLECGFLLPEYQLQKRVSFADKSLMFIAPFLFWGYVEKSPPTNRP